MKSHFFDFPTKNYTPIFFFLYLICSASNGLAQTTLEKYDTETIYLQNGKYIKNGEVHRIGWMAKHLEKEMIISKPAQLEFSKYKRNMKKGLVSSFVGLTAILIAPSFKDTQLQAGFLVGGLTSLAVSIPFSFNAGNQFQRSIWLRNKDALK